VPVMIGLVHVAFFFQRRYWPVQEADAAPAGAGADVLDLGCPTTIGHSIQTETRTGDE
jgi:hypothetical protein